MIALLFGGDMYVCDDTQSLALGGSSGVLLDRIQCQHKQTPN
jgi:hypothetical protein